jgi:UDP-N-acetylglucosamine--N-acetylmuramyl-(pentapeptide) pyrophosphoryl-undecaprenol N-acetylglucosamine transferase
LATSILLAGGGTGGHIYPNVAIAERLRERGGATVHFLVSDRPGDAQILERLALPFTASPAKPLPSLRKPKSVLSFASGMRHAVRQVKDVVAREGIDAVVATGGFVSGPAILAAARLQVPRVLVNLDAVPGQANRHLGRICSKVFSTYASPLLPRAELIGLPLRRVSVADATPARAREQLGLRPELATVFVTGATHGAQSVIEAMMELVADPERARRFAGWQVFHQCGTFDVEQLQRTYAGAGVEAKVVAYCDDMGLAYRASDLVVSRAGAGSVAEAWANATPTVFLPNPYHRDQHQRHNAAPMVDSGGAVIVNDEIDAKRTVATLAPTLFALLDDENRRAAMRRALEATRPRDGADAVAEFLASL